MKRRTKAMLAIVTSVVTLTTSLCAHAYTGVDAWFADEIEEADVGWGIIPECLQDQNLRGDITREEFCRLLLKSYETLFCSLPEPEDSHFGDTDDPYANAAYELDIISGYPDGTFRGDNPITRQEMFVMLYNFLRLADDSLRMSKKEAVRQLSDFGDHDEVAEWALVPAAVMAQRGILRGTGEESMDPLSNTSRAQAIVLADRLLCGIAGAPQYAGRENNADAGEDLVDNEEEGGTAAEPENKLYELGRSEEKYTYIFGSPDAGTYQSESEAEAHMTQITVDVWQLGADGEKSAGKRTLQVNEAIADMVKEVFKEIYEGDEKFPIKDIGCYSWRASGTSEHRWGLAIDINANENYMIKSDGTVVCGSFWEPGSCPYSIAEDGDVVSAFAKYGFSWGGNAWRSSHDYMHFSYLGT